MSSAKINVMFVPLFVSALVAFAFGHSMVNERSPHRGTPGTQSHLPSFLPWSRPIRHLHHRGDRWEHKPMTEEQRLYQNQANEIPTQTPGGPNTQLEAPNGMNRTRDGRFLSIFTVVQFPNTGCLSSSGDNGTCYTQKECQWRGGSSNGVCAGGYGVCCIFTHTCGDTTSQNGTYFVNGGYPSSYDGTGSCQLTIRKCSEDVCQIRLDFDSFTVAQPAPSGICQNDQFIVGGGNPVPTICGTNTGNHMYIDAGASVSSPITLTFVTSGMSFGRSWKIRVTQVPCWSLQRSPDGCLQYYHGVSGYIKSYNFDLGSGGQQLSNQDYSSCIRMEMNFCSIRYTACQDSTAVAGTAAQRSRAFSLTGTATGTAGAAVGAASCQTDWITIPCATNTGRLLQAGNTICQDRICGDVFNSEASATAAPVYSYVKPFSIYYHTDGMEPEGEQSKGYCLQYIQQPCTNNINQG